MPQINQLALTSLYSQFFWLLLVLAAHLFRDRPGDAAEDPVDRRRARQRIADDLAAAEAARTAADETEEAYRARIDESRAEALKVAAAAKAGRAPGRPRPRMRAADAEIGAKVEAAEARIRAATDAALAEIESVAAEAAQDMVDPAGRRLRQRGRGGQGSEGGDGQWLRRIPPRPRPSRMKVRPPVITN